MPFSITNLSPLIPPSPACLPPPPSPPHSLTPLLPPSLPHPVHLAPSPSLTLNKYRVLYLPSHNGRLYFFNSVRSLTMSATSRGRGAAVGPCVCLTCVTSDSLSLEAAVTVVAAGVWSAKHQQQQLLGSQQ